MNSKTLCKIIGGCICIAIWLNGAAHSTTLGEVAVGALVWLGGAAALFCWASKDRKAKGSAFSNMTVDLGKGDVKITDLRKRDELPK